MTVGRGEYGVDGPGVVAAYGATALALLAAAALLAAWGQPGLALAALLLGLAGAAATISFLWTTRRGKFAVWESLLDALRLDGGETLLDVGCGRGAVLVAAARRLPRGRAVGVDIWSKADQSGNGEAAVRANAEAEGVGDRVETRTCDMRALPFADGGFDLVVSSLAIHNVPEAEGRAQALAEILRVLKPGGKALIADVFYARDYARWFAARPGVEVERRRLGWRLWFFGPLLATQLVTVVRSAS
jgi:arsenite methyltransferase